MRLRALPLVALLMLALAACTPNVAPTLSAAAPTSAAPATGEASTTTAAALTAAPRAAVAKAAPARSALPRPATARATATHSMSKTAALNADGSCIRGLGRVPDVNGRYYTDAINTLRADGYDNVKINKVEVAHYQQGLVLGQDVPGFPVCKDLAVWLDVGSMMGSIDHIANG